MKKYTFGFEPWGLALFLLIMIPTAIWSAIPAPNDVPRTPSATPRIDAIGSVFQALMIATVCFVKNRERAPFRATPLVACAALCCLLYGAGWAAYYCGATNAVVILGLTVPPCMASFFFALDRKNGIALVPILGFTACHVIYAAVNFLR